MDLKQALKQLQTREGQGPAAARPGAPMPKAPLVEIFHSVQGEGRFVGVPMSFLRVATCPLRCLYCDTPHSYTAATTFPVRLAVRSLNEGNPVAADRAAELVRQVAAACEPGARQGRVSVTGGEPLVFPEFVREFGRAVRGKGMRLHLETAAIDPDALAKCVDQVDHLSADYKLPETLGAPARPELALTAGAHYGASHRRCCELAIQRGATVDVKIVLTDKVQDPSFEQALAELQAVRDKILLVLQPATPCGAAPRSVQHTDLARFLASSQRAGFDVRVLPQVHKQLKLP
ncbi:MAG: 7-carboxy-7-deazaguanine synthase QueE [Planctomycetes bacterium]|nr:7-carboxy-7-deazaguanine synthase QueE [Planctomycetota bacterium]